jgi:hypothetical protein
VGVLCVVGAVLWVCYVVCVVVAVLWVDDTVVGAVLCLAGAVLALCCGCVVGGWRCVVDVLCVVVVMVLLWVCCMLCVVGVALWVCCGYKSIYTC